LTNFYFIRKQGKSTTLFPNHRYRKTRKVNYPIPNSQANQTREARSNHYPFRADSEKEPLVGRWSYGNGDYLLRFQCVVVLKCRRCF